MPNRAQLSSLIRLIEDESVRGAVLTELAAYGQSLEDFIREDAILLSKDQARAVRPLLDERYHDWIRSQWKGWFNVKSDKARLEHGLSILSQYQLGILYPSTVRAELDALADEYDARYTQRGAIELAEFLFQGYGLRGVGQDDYYNPLNSNLIQVIERRAGIPISLASIYMLVGERLDLTIEGCNFPGHFLAIAATGRDKVIVDCFNGGMQIDEPSLAAATATVTKDEILAMQCSAAVMIARVLRNLLNAYQHERNSAAAETITGLLHTVEAVL